MVEVYNRNVVCNFKYTIKAVTIVMSRIVLKRLNADHKLLFRKLEKDLKYYTKLNSDIQFLLLLLSTVPSSKYNRACSLAHHIIPWSPPYMFDIQILAEQSCAVVASHAGEFFAPHC